MKNYDVVLKGGTLIDPSQGLHSLRDISFCNGKVAKIGKKIAPINAENVIDCSGYIITPGLIDIHTHTFFGGSM